MRRSRCDRSGRRRRGCSLVVGAATAAGPSPAPSPGSAGRPRGGAARCGSSRSRARATRSSRRSRPGLAACSASARSRRLGIPLAAFDGTTTRSPTTARPIVASTRPRPGQPSRASPSSTRAKLRDPRSGLAPRHVVARCTLTGRVDALPHPVHSAQDMEQLPRPRLRPRGGQARRRRDRRQERPGRGDERTADDPGLGADATWAYTLYSRDASTRRRARLHPRARHEEPQRPSASTSRGLPGPTRCSRVRMSLTSEGLVLTQRGVGRLAVVDTESYKVQTLRAPVAGRSRAQACTGAGSVAFAISSTTSTMSRLALKMRSCRSAPLPRSRSA